MTWEDWARAVFGLVATLALIGLAALAVRRFGFANPLAGAARRRMEMVERLFIDPRRQLVLVRLDGEEHLILLSASGDRRIATRAAPTVAAAEEPS